VTSLAPILEGFFTQRLAQRNASPHTVASHRDCWRLLLGYAQRRTGKAPERLDLADLDADLIGGFLDHLQQERANTTATRNLRLTAIQQVFRYASLRCPEHAAAIQKVQRCRPRTRHNGRPGISIEIPVPGFQCKCVHSL
jgi:integrase/recombinase XerD